MLRLVRRLSSVHIALLWLAGSVVFAGCAFSYAGKESAARLPCFEKPRLPRARASRILGSTQH